MVTLWKPYVTWSDTLLLTRMMNKLQESIVESLSRGKDERGVLLDDSMLRVNLIELQSTITRIRKKDISK